MSGTVKVTLKNSIGLRRKGGGARHYGPGTVDIPLADAQSLGIVDESGEVTAAYRDREALREQQRGSTARPNAARNAFLEDEEDTGDEEGGEEYGSWTVDQLRVEAENRELTVTRKGGGAPLKADYVKALKKHDKG